MQILNQFDPIENEDYLRRNVAEQVKQGGVNIKKEYTLRCHNSIKFGVFIKIQINFFIIFYN